MTASDFTRGIRENAGQVAHQLIQVMLVGFAIGMTRTVVPALAEREFGLERGSFLLLASFVVAFGAVKAVMNFVAGRLSEDIRRFEQRLAALEPRQAQVFARVRTLAAHLIKEAEPA